MGAVKVAIIGAGDLAALLAGRLPAGCRKLIIAPRRSDAVILADEVGGIASDQLAAARGSELVVLTVGAAESAQLIPQLLTTLEKDTLVVNMSPDLPTDELIATYPDRRFAGLKLVGDPKDMLAGAEGGLVLSGVAAEDRGQLLELFGALGPVVSGSEEQVRAARDAIAEEMSRAAAVARRRLEERGMAPDLVRMALITTAPGILRSLRAEGAEGRRSQSYML